MADNNQIRKIEKIETDKTEYYDSADGATPRQMVNALNQLENQDEGMYLYLELYEGGPGVPIQISTIGFEPDSKRAVLTFTPNVSADIIQQAKDRAEQHGHHGLFPGR